MFFTDPSCPGTVSISQQHEFGDRYHSTFALVVQHGFHLGFDRVVQLGKIFRLHGFLHQIHEKTTTFKDQKLTYFRLLLYGQNNITLVVTEREGRKKSILIFNNWE